MIDYLEAGDTTEDFLNDFPTVTRKQILTELESMRARLVATKTE